MLPKLLLAPVTPPVIVPTVHTKLLASLDNNAKFVLIPLQILLVAAFVTAGFGFTVIVIEEAEPTHIPAVEAGITIYCKVPLTALLGLVNVWLIVSPQLLLLAPVMPPVIVPIVHE